VSRPMEYIVSRVHGNVLPGVKVAAVEHHRRLEERLASSRSPLPGTSFHSVTNRAKKRVGADPNCIVALSHKHDVVLEYPDARSARLPDLGAPPWRAERQGQQARDDRDRRGFAQCRRSPALKRRPHTVRSSAPFRIAESARAIFVTRRSFLLPVHRRHRAQAFWNS